MDRDLLIYAGIGLLVVLAGAFVFLHLRTIQAGRPGGVLLAVACVLALGAVAVPVALLATGAKVGEDSGADEGEASNRSAGGNESAGEGGKPSGSASAGSGEAATGVKDPPPGAPAMEGDPWYVGRWSSRNDCARSLEFRADGTFVTSSGQPGNWQVEIVDGAEILDMRAGSESGRVAVERVGGSEMRLTPTDGSEVVVVTRC